MTDPALLFREEALLSRGEALNSGQETLNSRGQALRGRPGSSGPGRHGAGGHRRVRAVSPRWVRRAYWGLLALVVAGLWGTMEVQVAEVAQGPAVVQGGMVVAVVPEIFAAELRAGLPLELRLPGRAVVTVTVGSIGPELTGAADVSKVLGANVTGAGLPPGTLLVVRAAVSRQVGGQGAGQEAGVASVRVGSQRLIVTLATGLAPGASGDSGASGGGTGDG